MVVYEWYYNISTARGGGGIITYLPHKAVAEVSKHREPKGRKCGIQLVRMSMDFKFNCFEFQLI